MQLSRRNLLKTGLFGATSFTLVPFSMRAAQAACPATTWTLWAGQTRNVGTLTVTNDATNIYVTYTLTWPGATFGTLHLWIGSDILLVPKNPQGIPVPGQFPYQYNATGLTSYTFTVPLGTTSLPDLATLCPVVNGTVNPATLYVVAHAEVVYSNPGDGDGDTAFGGDTPGPGPRWWYYGAYTVCCDPSTDTGFVCQTAFAKGNSPSDHYVFTTDPRSNPEGLPSLKLIKNRWGWAIKVIKNVPTSYLVYAGAGLNNVAKGRLVGRIDVNWDGSNVTVTYVMSGAFRLEEVHVYASDNPPTTFAPGQYGYTQSFDPKVATHTVNIDVNDDNGDNQMWLIAHAVVCRPTT